VKANTMPSTVCWSSRVEAAYHSHEQFNGRVYQRTVHTDGGGFTITLVTATSYGKNGFVPTLVGTGPTAKRVVSVAGHPGIWQLTSLTTASNAVYVTPIEYQTGFFPVLTFRAVIQTGATLPVGATGATTYGLWKFGLVDLVGSLAPSNEISWNFDVSVSANWQLYLTKASTTTKTVSTVAVAANTWYDFEIWIGSTGVQARCAVYSPTALPTLLAGGPFTTNQPLTTTAMIPQVLNMNGTAGTTSLVLNLDLEEFVGLGNATAGVTTNFRGAAMTKGF